MTERARSLAAERERFQEAFRHAPIGMVLTDPDGRFLEVNEAYCDITGYSPDELTQSDITFESLTHPADRRHNLEVYRRLVDGEIPSFFVEKRYIRKDGGTVWVRASATVRRDADGRAINLVGLVENVTARVEAEQALRESEGRFRLLADNISQFAWMGDASGWLFWYNQRWFEYTGATLEEMEGWGWQKVHHPDHVDRVTTRFKEHIEAGRAWEDIFPLRRNDGEYRWFLSRAMPVRDDSGSVVRWFGTNTDITAQREAEEALRRAHDELEQRVAERTAELDSMNSALQERARQLARLTSDLTFAEQRERRHLAKILHDHIQQLLVAARMQLERLCRDLPEGSVVTARGIEDILVETLDACRSLTVELSPPILHEAGLVAGVTWLASRMGEKHGLRVEVAAEAGAEPQTEEVRFLLFECVRELLFNVTKHAGVSKARVALRPTPEGEVLLEVSDSGRGFDPDLLLQRRSDEATFGLFSIQQRIEPLGGRVFVLAAPGKGASVRVTLPLGAVAPSERQSETGWRARKIVQRSRAAQDALHVLIVDDHKIMREGLAGLLMGEAGIEVIGEAASGPDALDRVAQLQPDVVIMDVSMPGMSGIEATRLLMQRHPEVAVIGLSMHEESNVGAAMREAGARAFLTKGGPSEALIDAIRASAPQVQKEVAEP
ncbi:MAG: PAS domain S-box protein [Candidatus Hydrogenedentes bacterium]|nr:PAS domain S-box protein [Candidatus Hydrogenedentota bacterium]